MDTQPGIKETDIKDQLKRIADIIDTKLDGFWQAEMAKNFGFSPHQRELVDKMLFHSREHNLRPGKRLRGALVYYGYMLGLGENEMPDDRIWPAVISVELIQTALLMHDDFMDQDDLRRGLPTTHKIFGREDQHYGDAIAVNLGDAIISLGYESLINSEFEPKLVNQAASLLLRGIVNTVWGQVLDISLEKIADRDEADVMATSRTKTAIYTYENPLLIGATLAGLNDEVKDILREYATNAGIAFQIQDDILGVFGDPTKTGKSDNSDLLQGKFTLLVAKCLEGGYNNKEALLKVWNKKMADKANIEEAKNAMINSNALSYCRKTAKSYAEKSNEIIKRLEKNKLKNEAYEFLKKITEYMINREV